MANSIFLPLRGVQLSDNNVWTGVNTFSQPVGFPSGTVLLPAIYHTAEPSSGRYRIGAGNIGESILGVLKFDWNATRILSTIPIHGPNGAAATPTYTYGTATGSGWYLRHAGLGIHTASVNGTPTLDIAATSISIRSGADLVWSSTDDASGSPDVRFARAAARVLALGPTTGVRLDWSSDGILKLLNFAGSGNGSLALGLTPASLGILRLPNGQAVYSRNAANNGDINIFAVGASNRVELAGGGADILWGTPLVALGGGAAPILGTIGATGPTTAAQNSWMRIIDSAGAAFWVPVWK